MPCLLCRDMNRSGRELQSLEDTLAKGFASMHSEEETVEVEQPEEIHVQQEPTEPAVKPDYSKPTQSVENRSSFTVSSAQKASTAEPADAATTALEAVEVLEKPTSTLGDDFDVEW